MSRPGPTAREVGPFVPWMQRRLRRLMRGHKVDAAVPLRARIIWLLGSDPCVCRVASRLGVDRKTVRLWRDRFLAHGLKGLQDKPRPGRPVRIEAAARCELISMACARPRAYGMAFRRTWTFDALHEAFVTQRPDLAISRTTVFRILTGADLRPHRMSVWLHSQDPEFRRKATEICELYLSPPRDAVVLCVDEKTGMQALSRKHPTKWAGCGKPGRQEFEYVRHGTATLFAAFNTRTGQVTAQISKKRRASDLMRFMKEVARAYPKGEVHIVWDNLNIHHEGPSKRWTKFNRQQKGRFHFHYTPIHASWVNQVELFFSRLQRRVLRYGSFDSVEELGIEVLGYIAHWNQHERRPYRWTFRGYPLQEAQRAA
jgi:transposase